MKAESLIDQFFNHPLQRANPIVLLVLFTILVLNVLGRATRRLCNCTLQMFKMLVSLVLTRGSNSLTYCESELLKHFLHDIRGS